MSVDPVYRGFLGTWTLIPESCVYEQSEPPQEGTYLIREEERGLTFVIDWIDAEGEHHQISFSGNPSGERVPIPG